MKRMIALLTAVALFGSGCGDAAGGIVQGQWTGPGGNVLDSDVANTIRGPEHCDYQSSVWLSLGWPPGTEANDVSDTRRYIRDPENVLGLRSGLDTDTELPDDASSTGYEINGIELWLGDDGGDEAVFVVYPDRTERWPRANENIGCA